MGSTGHGLRTGNGGTGRGPTFEAKAGECKGSGFAVAPPHVPCSVLKSSLFRLRDNALDLARKPRLDWISAVSHRERAESLCANSLWNSLIQRIAAETGSLVTHPTANNITNTGPSGPFFVLVPLEGHSLDAEDLPLWPADGDITALKHEGVICLAHAAVAPGL